MLKHKIDILFFRKISHVYLKISNFKAVGKVNQFKSIYKIGEREDQKKRMVHAHPEMQPWGLEHM